jgi:uncharacterized protein YjbI with pentapeptide repeats
MVKRWAAWPRGLRWLTGGIVAVVLALAIAWVLFVPAADWLARHDVGSVRGPLLQTARDAARGRLLTLGAGLFVAGALVYTARNYSLSREGQVTDRYTKAIEQLGSDRLDVRIGGIYALERIARDSARDHPTVMEVLTAFAREHSREPWPPLPADDLSDAGRPTRTTRPDVQAAITVIGRRNIHQDRQAVNLTNARLAGANLVRANLTRTRLTGVNLSGANLGHADLTSAILADANLADAYLTGANLGEAVLTWAVLTRAYLTDANLAGAQLFSVDLTDADLTRADLTGADLTGADFAGADLTAAIWPSRVAIPDGWERDPSSGRLRRANADSGDSGTATATT